MAMQCTGHASSCGINILQGSVVTPMRRGWLCNDFVAANLLLSQCVAYMVSLFLTHGTQGVPEKKTAHSLIHHSLTL